MGFSAFGGFRLRVPLTLGVARLTRFGIVRVVGLGVAGIFRAACRVGGWGLGGLGVGGFRVRV